MIEGTLIGLAALAASANVVYGTVLVWGLSGGDGEGSVIGGILALVLFGSLIWTVVETMSLLEPVYRLVLIGFLVATGVISAYVLQATEDRRRRMWLAVGVGLACLVMTLVVGVGDGAAVSGRRPVLVALLPPLLLALGLIVVEGESADREGIGRLLVLGVLALPAGMLALAHL